MKSSNTFENLEFLSSEREWVPLFPNFIFWTIY